MEFSIFYSMKNKNISISYFAETSKIGLAGIFAGIFCLLFALIYTLIQYANQE